MQEASFSIGERTVTVGVTDGVGQPLIMMHGLAGSSRSFLKVTDALVSAGYRPITLNMPGYGGSDPLPDLYPEPKAIAAAVVATLDRLDLPGVDVLGHSLGGLLAATLAYHFPTRVRRMVLSSPPRGFALTGEPADWPDSQTQRIADLDAEGALAYGKKRAPGLCAPDATAEAVSSVRTEMERLTHAGLTTASALFARGDLLACMRGVVCPTAFIGAQLDRIVPEAVVIETATLTQRPYLILPLVAHAAYAEAPQAYAEAVINAFSMAR